MTTKIRHTNHLLSFSFILGILILAGCQTSGPNHQTSIAGDSNIPKDYQIRFETALSALKNQDYKAAEQTLTRLSQEAPNMAGPLANLGLISFIEKDYKKAKQLLDKATGLNSDIPQAQNLLGLIAINNKEINNAEKHFQKAVGLDGGYSSAHYNLALLYELYLQDMVSAAKHYKSYLETTTSEDTITKDWLSGIKSIIEYSE